MRKRILSLLVAVLMLLSLFPVSAFAEEEEKEEPQTEQEEILEETKEEQEPDTIVEEPVEHTHDYSAVVTEPTCTEQGYTTYTCACGASYVDDYTDALGHTPENAAEIPATCTKSGKTEGEKCAICGEILDGCTEIPALGHTVEEVAEVPAEVGKPGVTAGKVCSVCGEKETKTVAKISAQVVAAETLVEAEAAAKVADTAANRTTDLQKAADEAAKTPGDEAIAAANKAKTAAEEAQKAAKVAKEAADKADPRKRKLCD